VKSDVVPDEVDETLHHMKPVVVLERLNMDQYVTPPSIFRGNFKT